MAARSSVTRYTQSGIDAIFGVTSTRRKPPMEKIAYHGTYNGFPIVYTREYTGQGDDIPNVDDFVQATAWLGTLGISAPANVPVGQAAAPVMQQVPPTAQGYQPPPQPAYGWACPFHGTTKTRPGKDNRGVECAVGQPAAQGVPSWPHREWTGKNGTYYFCSAKSQ